MSIGLRALSAALRLYEKPRLSRLRRAEQMRDGLRRAGSLSPRPPRYMDSVVETFSRGRDEAPLAALKIGPREGDSTRVTLYLHGGAFIAGSPWTHRGLLWSLSRAFGGPVVAPDYALAPERPFPAALDDAVRAYDALAARLGGGRHVAIAGDSAGGGLAFALLYEIQRTGRDAPAAVAAFSPFADLTLSGRSLVRLARQEAMLPVSRFPEIVAAYAGDADPADPRVSPALANWRAPPPALIQVGSHEALRDDAARLAKGLRAAGGDVRLEVWRGAPHAFQFFAALLPPARRAVDAAGRFLATAIDGAPALRPAKLDRRPLALSAPRGAL